MYGVRLHPAKDREGTKLSLAVAHTGVLVFQVKNIEVEFNDRREIFKKCRILNFSPLFRDTQRLTPSTGPRFASSASNARGSSSN